MKKLTLIYLSLFCSPLAQASALYFYEIGTEDTALAGAGQAARAQDASTIVTNPAGMTRLPDHMFTGGLQAMDGDVSSRTYRTWNTICLFLRRYVLHSRLC